MATVKDTASTKVSTSTVKSKYSSGSLPVSGKTATTSVSTTPNTVKTPSSNPVASVSTAQQSSSKATAPLLSTPSASASATTSNSNGQRTSTAGVTPGYTPTGTYNDADNRAIGNAGYIDQQKAVYEQMKSLRNQALANGNPNLASQYEAKMQEAHANAEIYRSANGGYSGGNDGSEYITTPQNTKPGTWTFQIGNGQQAGQAGTNMIQGVYVDPNDQKKLSAADLQTLIGLKKEYAGATPERRQQINREAEAMRAKYGYSLGSAGNQFSAIELGEDILPQVGLPSLEANPEMINDLYNRLNEANLAQLMASYNNSRAESEYQMGKIPAMYQQQRNAVSADNEREKLAHREQAAASGLNAGNRSQANLAFANQLQNSLGQLNTAEANALSDATFALTQLYNNYQAQIAQAVAQNNYERAGALIEDYYKAKESAVNTALAQANLNLQVADFNRQTRQNAVTNQQNAWQQQFALGSELAGYGNMGLLGNLAGVSPAEIARLQQDFNVRSLGRDYPLIRGYL